MHNVFLGSLICLIAGAAPAQDRVAPPVPLKYDVVSVREHEAGEIKSSLHFDNGDMVKADNANVMMMITTAYDVPQFLVEGLPNWGMSKHFDIIGKITELSADQIKAMTKAQRRTMLATLLQDSFGLKTHWETKEKPEYILAVPKSGSKLKESSESQTTNVLRWNSLDARAIGMSDLAKDLERRVNKPIVDETGLIGKYDIKLTWSTGGQALNGGETKDEDSQAGIFAALRESLGLELKPQHGPVSVLVVDSISQPSPN
jgi:uncharacterized protein (TIGR03435 family)